MPSIVCILFSFFVAFATFASEPPADEPTHEPSGMLGHHWVVAVDNPMRTNGKVNSPYCPLAKGELVRLVNFHKTDYDYPSRSNKKVGPNSYVLEKFWSDWKDGKGEWYSAFDLPSFTEVGHKGTETFVDFPNEQIRLGIKHETRLFRDLVFASFTILDHYVFTTEYSPTSIDGDSWKASEKPYSVQRLILASNKQKLTYEYRIDSELTHRCEMIRVQR